MKTMELAKIDASQMQVSLDGRSSEDIAFTQKRSEKENSSDLAKTKHDAGDEAPKRKKGAKRKQPEESKPVQIKNGPRMSKRARKNQLRSDGVASLKASAGELEDGGFDISVDGQKLSGGDENDEG